MALGWLEILADAPELAAIIAKIKAAIASFPPAPAVRTAVMYATAFGIPVDSPLGMAAKLFDEVEAQAKTP
jgi:hypothetical protein